MVRCYDRRRPTWNRKKRAVRSWLALSVLASLFMLMGVSTAVHAQYRAKEDVKLQPEDVAPGELFGKSVAMSADGNVLVIGSKYDNFTGIDAGAAYIYRYDPGSSTWLNEAIFVGSTTTDNDRLGQTVDVSDDGNVIAVGSQLNDDVGNGTGIVYIVRYDPGNQMWAEEARLHPHDATEGDWFGTKVSFSPDGQMIAVGAIRADQAGYRSGSIYVFRYDSVNGEWWEEAEVVPADLEAQDNLGRAIDVGHNVIVAGRQKDNNAKGSVTIFRYDGSQWIEEQTITASNGGKDDYFGCSVSIDGDMLVAGAYMPGDINNPGAAYVFEYDGSVWTEKQILLPFKGEFGDQFGWDVAIAGNVIAVAANYFDKKDGVYRSGTVFMYEYNAGSGIWATGPRLVASDMVAPREFQNLGTSIDMTADGSMVLAGAPGEVDRNIPCAAYLFYEFDRLFDLDDSPRPLVGGAPASFEVTDAWPDSETYLLYTLKGSGQTRIPALNVTVYLQYPKLAFPSQRTDANGRTSWVETMPNVNNTALVWMQVVQSDGVSYPIRTQITPGTTRVLYVDDDAPPGGDGLSWATAFNNPKAAMKAANGSEQIWIASGRYSVSNLEIKNLVELCGGFAGYETKLNERDVQANPTVLSANQEDRMLVAEDVIATIDGLTIIEGNAWRRTTERGGGLFAGGGAHVTVRNCMFMGNKSNRFGGAIYIDDGSTASIERTSFMNNLAVHGGAIRLPGGGDTTVSDCLFYENGASTAGGAVYVDSNGSTQPEFINCTFVDNRTKNPSAGYGGAIHILGGTECALTNCVVWHNSEPQLGIETGAIASFVVEYSNVQGGYAGTGNIDVSPHFMDWIHDDLRYHPGSVGIDAGNNDVVTSDFDLLGEPRRVDDPNTPDTGFGVSPLVDMGAFEFQAPNVPYLALDVEPNPLAAGENVTFVVSHGAANGTAFVYYTLAGLGGTAVTTPSAVTLFLHSPGLAGDSIQLNVDGAGSGEWFVSPALFGQNIWFQAVEMIAGTSNVVATTVAQ
jgi:hypothetical protein